MLLASGNAKKLRELRLVLAGVDVELATPDSIGGLPDVVEDRPDFRGNAAKKAVSAASHARMWALADDSGLEVDALGGAPGVFSARFAGKHGDDAANNRLLLERLAHVPDGERGARFVCALALARPDASLALEVTGTARGTILREPRGTHDFGYDPLFLFTEPGFEQTGRGFAELDAFAKAAVSHRGRALRDLAAKLPLLLRAGPGTRAAR
ncbi:MAG: non-canonical purine NTP pyrophosphatase [Planctomycetota bacterium]|nr:non-canonical purine NTP pyrophosphatase [Planctomycetota bacterium]